MSLLNSLTSFSVKDSVLRGNLENGLGGLTTLERLVLHDNGLSGTIPYDLLKKNANLTLLQLSRNRFKGTISDMITAVPKLRTLHLGDNELNGTIPSEMGLLSRLSKIMKSCFTHCNLTLTFAQTHQF